MPDETKNVNAGWWMILWVVCGMFVLWLIIDAVANIDTHIDGSGGNGHEFGAKEWPNGGSRGGYMDIYCERRDQPLSVARVNANLLRVWCGKMPYFSKPTDDWDAGDER